MRELEGEIKKKLEELYQEWENGCKVCFCKGKPREEVHILTDEVQIELRCPECWYFIMKTLKKSLLIYPD